jgi:predicted PurR-regulated permease PerM
MTRRALHTPPPWTARRVVLATLTVLAIAGSAWLLYRFRTVWITLLVAIVLASSVKPMMAWLTAKGVPRKIAALGIEVVILTLAIGFIVLVLPMVLAQLPAIAAKLGGLYQGARAHLLVSSSNIVARLAGYLPPTLPGAGGAAPATVAHGVHALGSLLRGLFLVIAVPVFAFLWTVDGERAVRTLVLVVPEPRRQGLREFVGAAEKKMGAFVRGQAIVCACVAALSAPAYLLIGVPHALVLALLAGVLEVLSYPGTVIAGGLAVLVALTQSPLKGLWVVIAVVGINLTLGYVVAPRVMRAGVGVSAFVRLLAITTLGFVGGIAGVFLAIPAAAVLKLVLERFARSQRVQAGAS